MSHIPHVFSPPGTPLADRTVGELVAERPGRSRVFQSYDIDFCCRGGLTLREACQRKSISIDPLIEQLEAELADKSPSRRNPAELAPDELVTYIVETHHGFLRRELPRLHAMSERVAQVHGGHTPALVEIFQIFRGIELELSSHMLKEEQVLFPAVVALVQDAPAPESLDGPISCMIHEHEEVGGALERLREISHGYQPPFEACNTYRALFAGLRELEEDLHRHIHLENAVLFPTAQSMASSRAKSALD